MRTTIRCGLMAASLALATAAAAQTGAPPAPPLKTFASSAEVAALMAKAKAVVAADPKQTNVAQPLLSLAPYQVNLEYRTGHAVGAVHEIEAELFYVVDGSGTMVTGGKLANPTVSRPHNLNGEIVGGEAHHLSKGDVLFVPQDTPHQVTQVDGVLVLMSMHVPRP